MSSVVDVEPRDLPRVRARDAAALTRAARVVAGLPARLEAPLGELGSVALMCEGVDALAPTVAGESAGDVVLGLSRGAGAGRLVLDGALARRVIALALGGEVRPGAPLARLGLGERGVVAGVVASVLHGLGAPFSVALIAPSAAPLASEGGVAFALAVTVGAARGWARLEVPSRWLAAGPAPELGALEVEARVELARTRLSAGELADVAPGDAIVFDGEPSGRRTAGAARSVRVVVGAHAARARLSDDGRVTLEDALRPATSPGGGRSGLVEGQARQEVIMERRDEGDGEKTRIVDAAAVLAAAPIEVVAELGRFVLRGEEIAGLGPGAVLTLGRAGASPVALRVGDEIWAEGELVDVDGELGVRVTTARRSGSPDRPR
jgi:type III secretion system YscQ/HrcQ family protein